MTAPNSRTASLFAHAGLFYAAAIWGSTFFLVKATLSSIDPVTLVAYRFLLAAGIMFVFLLVTRRNPWRGFKQGAILAVILWLLYVPQTIGLAYTTASNSGFITGLFVAFIPLFQKTIFRQLPTRMELLASALSLAGLWFLTGGLTDINRGDLLTLLAAVTYALHVLYTDKYVRADVDPYALGFQQFLIVGLLSLAAAIVLDLPLSVGSPGAWWTVLFLGIFPTLSAFLIQLFAQRIVAPLRVSLVFALEPVFAGVFAWTLGGEQFLIRSAVGGGLIFVALIVSGLPTPRRLRRAR